MKIAIASRWVSGLTGTTTTILEHSRRLSQLGWDVHVFGQELDAGRLKDCGATPHVLSTWFLRGYWRRRAFAWLFEKEIDGIPFDLVWGHGDTFTQDILSLHNCVHAAHEAVYSRRLEEDSSVGRMHGRMLKEKKFKLLIANSKLMREEVVHRFAVPENRVAVIYPGYDASRFNPEGRVRLRVAVRGELKIGPDVVLAGFITSGDFAKRGLAIFLEALTRLDVGLKSRMAALVMGREGKLSGYRASAARSGVKVHFLEPAADIERFYHSLDIYVHPALYEEFGQSVQEALACGLPVVTTNRVGAAELLKGECLDGVVPARSPEALAARLTELGLDSEKRRRMGRAGASAVLGNSWDENFRRTRACYEELLRQNR